MIVRKGEKFLTLVGRDSSTLIISEANRGEPSQFGLELSLDDAEGSNTTVFIDRHEVVELRDLLNRLYPTTCQD